MDISCYCWWVGKLWVVNWLFVKFVLVCCWLVGCWRCVLMCRHPAPDCSPSPNRLLSLLQSLRPTIVLISISYFNIYCNTLLIPFQFLGIAQKYSMIRKMKSKLKLLFAPDIYKTKNYHKLLPPPYILVARPFCYCYFLFLFLHGFFRVFHGFA